MQELVAAVGRYMNRARRGQDSKAPPTKRPNDEKRDRPPRKCPNCIKEHPGRVCPYPSINRSIEIFIDVCIY